MGLEAATYIGQLNPANPVGATDPKSQGDDHLRLIKSVLQAQFTALGNAAVTVTAAQLNAAGGSGITGFAVSSVLADVLAATAGAATTALRSDARIAINQAMTPTWSDQHIFTKAIASGISNYAVLLSSAAPAFALNETDAAANNRVWDMIVSGEVLSFRATNDAVNAATAWLTVNRTLNVIDDVSFPQGAFNVTGAATFANVVAAAGAVRSTGFITGVGGALESSSASPGVMIYETDAGANSKRWLNYAAADVLHFGTFLDDGSSGNDWLTVTRSGANPATVVFPNGTVTANNGLFDGTCRVRDIPRVTGGLEIGKCFATSAGFTLNTGSLSAGIAYSVYNDSAAAITITQGGGVTLRLAGTTSTGNRTLAARGFCTIWCNSGSEAIAMGDVS